MTGHDESMLSDALSQLQDLAASLNRFAMAVHKAMGMDERDFERVPVTRRGDTATVMIPRALARYLRPADWEVRDDAA